MVARFSDSWLRGSFFFCLTIFLASSNNVARAINITFDYRYDTGHFFDVPGRKPVLEAAAARYSAIITTSLSAVTVANDSVDARIAFSRPDTGAPWVVSPATSTANDAAFSLYGMAQEYRGPWSVSANEWIIYPGARSLIGRVAEGLSYSPPNLPSVYSNSASILNRGFRAAATSTNLPMWGGSIAFNTGTLWHFDLNTAAPSGITDFYTHAVHEIGHVLGLSSPWSEWTQFSPPGVGRFSGPRAVAAYNADNGTALTSLAEASATDYHWQDGTYDSFIFQNGGPKYAGTVGAASRQDLLMEVNMNFSNTAPIIRRFELTNVDVAALRDVGWSVVPTLIGDYNGDSSFNAADYVLWRNNSGTPSAYNSWRSNFGAAGAVAFEVAAVPEPAAWTLILVATIIAGFSRPLRLGVR